MSEFINGHQSGSGRASETPCPLGYSEAFWIDRLLAGNSDDAPLANHLKDCACCRETVEQWSLLLPESRGISQEVSEGYGTGGGGDHGALGPTVPGAQPFVATRDGEQGVGAVSADLAGKHAELAANAALPYGEERGVQAANAAREDVMAVNATRGDGMSANANRNDVVATNAMQLPRDAIRRKLRRRVAAIGRGRVPAATRLRKQLAVAAMAAVILVAVVWLYQSVRDPADQRSQFVVQHEPQAAALMSDPETASYRVHPSSRDLGEGFVWFNNNSAEAMVMLEGVLPSEGHDVQVWAIIGVGRANLGLLRYEDNRAHLYVRGGALSQADNIALTVEPTGGSISPTSPDAFVFRLERR